MYVYTYTWWIHIWYSYKKYPKQEERDIFSLILRAYIYFTAVFTNAYLLLAGILLCLPTPTGWYTAVYFLARPECFE